MKQEVYQILAFLLTYPNREINESLPELKEEIKNIDDELIKRYLLEFMDTSLSLSLDEWIDHYIDHFDFGRTTNLYMTYLKLGEQRERGLELLKLKKFYEAHGFEITEKELPDYLPLMLEFCANVSQEVSHELFNMHGQAMREMQKRLTEAHSFYHLLFDALFVQMENNGLKIITKVTH